MSLVLNNTLTERWRVIFMIRSPTDQAFVKYREEQPPFAGVTPMARIDIWAELQLIDLQKRVPEAQFSYRLEHR